MIYLITGKPGSFKTTYGVKKLFALKDAGRKVYARGIKDFDYQRAGVEPILDGTKWEELPDGSVILMDEAYDVFPSAAPGSKVPPHIEAMARHRHRGFDFILICQQPLQLHWFLRGLVEEHSHLSKKWNTKNVDVKRWDEYQGNTKALSNNKTSWTADLGMQEYFTSTTLNTAGGLKIPKWAQYLAIFSIICVTLGWYVVHRNSQKIDELKAERAETDTPGLQGGSGFARTAPPATPAEYATRAMPRLAAAPWSAPLYDARQPMADPQLFCMSAGPGRDGDGHYRSDRSCVCKTEQGTIYKIETAVCESLVESGGIYNPYKAPAVAVVPPPVVMPEQPTQVHASAPSVAIGGGPEIGSGKVISSDAKPISF